MLYEAQLENSYALAPAHQKCTAVVLYTKSGFWGDSVQSVGEGVDVGVGGEGGEDGEEDGGDGGEEGESGEKGDSGEDGVVSMGDED